MEERVTVTINGQTVLDADVDTYSYAKDKNSFSVSVKLPTAARVPVRNGGIGMVVDVLKAAGERAKEQNELMPKSGGCCGE